MKNSEIKTKIEKSFAKHDKRKKNEKDKNNSKNKNTSKNKE